MGGVGACRHTLQCSTSYTWLLHCQSLLMLAYSTHCMDYPISRHLPICKTHTIHVTHHPHTTLIHTTPTYHPHTHNTHIPPSHTTQKTPTAHPHQNMELLQAIRRQLTQAGYVKTPIVWISPQCGHDIPLLAQSVRKLQGEVAKDISMCLMCGCLVFVIYVRGCDVCMCV